MSENRTPLNPLICHRYVQKTIWDQLTNMYIYLICTHTHPVSSIFSYTPENNRINKQCWHLVFTTLNIYKPLIKTISNKWHHLSNQPGIYSKAVGSCLVGFRDIQAGPEEIHKVVRLPPEVSFVTPWRDSKMCHGSNYIVDIHNIYIYI